MLPVLMNLVQMTNMVVTVIMPMVIMLVTITATVSWRGSPGCFCRCAAFVVRCRSIDAVELADLVVTVREFGLNGARVDAESVQTLLDLERKLHILLRIIVEV